MFNVLRCLANGGEEVLNEYLVEQENLIYCMMTQFDLEVNTKYIFTFYPLPNVPPRAYLAVFSGFPLLIHTKVPILTDRLAPPKAAFLPTLIF